MHSYSNIYVHLVFATKMRVPFIGEDIRVQTESYISGIIKARESLLIRHYLMPDHYHSLIRLHPDEKLSDLLYALKVGSTKWLNEALFKGAFSWQTGYGAFSHLSGDLDRIIQYIMHQPEHHKTMSLADEAEKLNRKYDCHWILD